LSSMADSSACARRDRVEVAREVEVDVLHGHDLRVAAAGGAALHAEDRVRGSAAQAEHDLLPSSFSASARPTATVDLPSPAGVGLMPVTSTRRPWLVAARQDRVGVDLRLVVAVELDVVGPEVELLAISAIGRIFALCAISMSVHAWIRSFKRAFACTSQVLGVNWAKIGGAASAGRFGTGDKIGARRPSASSELAHRVDALAL
jgi:hypothetical protein